MKDYKDSGKNIVEVVDWREFSEFIEETFHDNNEFIFRGQRCESWSLETSIDRMLKKVDPDLQTENVVYEHFSRFKNAIRGKRGNNPPELKNENENWALGQHYGLATPLLDWSYSPYIATFFAFNDSDAPTSGKRAVWALNTTKVIELRDQIMSDSTVKGRFNYIEENRDPILDFVKPSTDDNPRIINQAGLFSRSPLLISVDKWVELLHDLTKGPILYKIIVPDDERYYFVWALEKMNIHSGSLFPDISGACMYCNDMFSIYADALEVKKGAAKLFKIMTAP